ncbi:MAG: class I SAM-dependent methyltransferase [Caldimonas sp.]
MTQERGDAPLDKVHVNLVCEVCDGTQSSPWRTLRYPQFQHPGTFALRRCDGCGLVYNSPRLDGDALARLYDRNYYIFNEPVPAAFERVVGLYRATVARLEARLQPGDGRRLLEVGSAKGYMLALLRDRGWQAEGVELSGHAASFAERTLQAPTFHGTLEAWVERPGHLPHPAAYCTDVIEHVPSPLRFVETLYRALQPGALVLIGTPNVDSDGVREHGEHWLGFNPFHIWLFSRQTLSRLLDRCGFDVIEAWTFGNVQLEREPEVGTAKRWLRDTLGRTGLLGPLRSLRSRGQSEVSATKVATLRAEAARQMNEGTPWADSADGRHPRAASAKGDNLVILARRRADPAPPSEP